MACLGAMTAWPHAAHADDAATMFNIRLTFCPCASSAMAGQRRAAGVKRSDRTRKAATIMAETKTTPPGLKAAIIPVTGFQQNCTLLWNPETMQGAVVDPGGNLDAILKAIAEVGIKVEKILLTHGHI